jgi:hypothetical protein
MKSLKIMGWRIAICVAITCVLGSVACPNNKATEAALAAGQRAADIAEIQNVMSLHSWYHAAQMNDVEIEKVWAHKTPDVVLALNAGYWKGMHSIKRFYGRKMDPKDTAGVFVWHAVTSPVVEVAEDRKTAKGVWYTPGLVGAYKNGKAGGAWMWEKYGVDFVNEDGKWKIWHMHIYTDAAIPVGKAIDEDGIDYSGEAVEALANEAAARAGRAPAPVNGPDVRKRNYMEWGPAVSPHLVPRPPEPYKTFSETFSYVDENEYK